MKDTKDQTPPTVTLSEGWEFSGVGYPSEEEFYLGVLKKFRQLRKGEQV